MTIESFVLEDLKKWHAEIEKELTTIQNDINSKNERLRILEARMSIVQRSYDELGHNPERRKNHWNLYGKPCEDEYHTIDDEISVMNKELVEKRKSLSAIRDTLENTIKANQ